MCSRTILLSFCKLLIQTELCSFALYLLLLEVWSIAQDTKAAQETRALQEFYHWLATDSARAFYGSGHVMAAHELQAIQTLLISDKLFRTNDVAKVRSGLGAVI